MFYSMSIRSTDFWTGTDSTWSGVVASLRIQVGYRSRFERLPTLHFPVILTDCNTSYCAMMDNAGG